MNNIIVSTVLAASLGCLPNAFARGVPSSLGTTIRALESQHPFPQTKLSSCEALPSVLHWGINDISYVDGELSIRGVDKLGRRYSFSKGAGAPGCELWASDLTGNGSSDLEIIVGGMDSSGGYDTTLTVLLFDADGRPFPWQATGKFSSGPKGIDQVISDGSANANILVSTDEGADTVNHNLVFELYKFSPQRVAKVEGASLGRTWPVMQTPNQSVIAHHSAALINLDLSANTTPSDSLVPTSTAQITGSSRLTLSTGVQTEPPVMLVVVGN